MQSGLPAPILVSVLRLHSAWHPGQLDEWKDESFVTLLIPEPFSRQKDHRKFDVIRANFGLLGPNELLFGAIFGYSALTGGYSALFFVIRRYF